MRPMVDFDLMTGKPISGWPRCRRALNRLWETAKGTRVMLRHYGSLWPDFIDRPISQSVILQGIADFSQQVRLFEPEFRLVRMQIVEADGGGVVGIDAQGIYLPDMESRSFRLDANWS